MISGLQGNDINTKIIVSDYFDNIKQFDLANGFILRSLENKAASFLTASYKEFLIQFSQGIIAADQNVNNKEINLAHEISTEK